MRDEEREREIEKEVAVISLRNGESERLRET